MQIKEVKIAGFQTEDLKLTLTYQVTNNWSRYIIRKNRKIIRKYLPYETYVEKAVVDFCGIIVNSLTQKKINI